VCLQTAQGFTNIVLRFLKIYGYDTRAETRPPTEEHRLAIVRADPQETQRQHQPLHPDNIMARIECAVPRHRSDGLEADGSAEVIG